MQSFHTAPTHRQTPTVRPFGCSLIAMTDRTFDLNLNLLGGLFPSLPLFDHPHKIDYIP